MVGHAAGSLAQHARRGLERLTGIDGVERTPQWRQASLMLVGIQPGQQRH
jgi:hypothetical protein